VAPFPAQTAPELLVGENFDIRLVIDRENKQVHAWSPDLTEEAPVRGGMIRNSVISAGLVSTSTPILGAPDARSRTVRNTRE
jgi:hypothetical protein